MSTSVVQQAVVQQAVVPVSPQVQTVPGITYRSLQPGDFDVLKATHAELFPIDYEDNFFIRATHGLDRIWSCAAVSTDAYGSEQLVGFITAKSVFLHEVDASDRQHMGLLSAVLDYDRVLYIMTLGVVQGHRHRGLASTLIAIACQQAYETRCRAVFLHVITYNTAAMSLYSRQGFSCVAKLRAFYYIATGRTPDPQQQVYDAYLYVQYVGGAAGVPSPWDLVSLAWSPLRLAFNRIHACMPGFCRAEFQPQQQSMLNGQPAPGWSNSSAGSLPQQQQDQPGWQQQQQHQQAMQVNEQPCHSMPVLHSPPGSRHRHGGPSLLERHLHHQQDRHHSYRDYGQQQQQYWPAEGDVLLRPQQQSQQGFQAQQHWQQQFSSGASPANQQQQHHAQQQQQESYMLHQGMQPPQQRMLRWLFNGASRGSSSMAAGEQQRHVGGEQHVNGAVRQQQWQEAADQHKQG